MYEHDGRYPNLDISNIFEIKYHDRDEFSVGLHNIIMVSWIG